MNNFELFKLKQAGLTNLNILALLDYQSKQEKSLSLRDMAVTSKCKNPILFMEKYKSLDSKSLRKVFNQYPSISILDDEYPIELKTCYNPPVLLFYQGNVDLLKRPKMAVVGARTASQT
ncbi:DNA-processing protein DprA, partial [uncultured Streptococcus sp.]|uniref:DNA-processing protein DprA n=1 Tax=uncultured Streptococcus sp. TaxID=83427 RepID=UPI00259066F2